MASFDVSVRFFRLPFYVLIRFLFCYPLYLIVERV